MTIWRDFDFQGRLYEVSEFGDVRDGASGRVLTQTLGSTGYRYANLSLGRKSRKCQTVHSLVAHCFHGPRPEGMQVRHLNGCKTDNRATNLAYGTRVDNARDSRLHGTFICGMGSRQAKLSDKAVLAIRRLKGLVPLKVMATSLGVSNSIVSQATLSTWKHVSGEIQIEDALRTIFGTAMPERGLDPFEIADRLFAEYRGDTLRAQGSTQSAGEG